MKAIHHKVEHDTIIREDTAFHGIINGSMTVSENVLLYFHGIANNQLILNKNSTAYLHGIVNGNVINRGGHLEVFGMVNGKVIREKGESIIHNDAVVRDGIH